MVTTANLHWAAGFLDGEGSFTLNGRHGIDVQASQVQRWPLEKLQELFGGSIFLVERCRRAGQQRYYRWRVSSVRAAGIMMTLFDLLSPRRQWQAAIALKAWNAQKPARARRTHCPQGHEYTKENTYMTSKGHRLCNACLRERGH